MMFSSRPSEKFGTHSISFCMINRVGAIEHAFVFTIRCRDRAGVEMIASDHDRCFDFSALDEFIHGHAEFGAFAVTEPANSRRQTLEMDPLPGELHPARERLIFRK